MPDPNLHIYRLFRERFRCQSLQCASLLLVAALLSCGQNPKTNSQAPELNIDRTIAELTDADASVPVGTYCYFNGDDQISLVTVAKDNSVTGGLQGGSAGEESEYTLYNQTLEGAIAGDQLGLTVVTQRRDEKDVETTETWTLSSTELVTANDTLEFVDCESSGANLIFDREAQESDT